MTDAAPDPVRGQIKNEAKWPLHVHRPGRAHGRGWDHREPDHVPGRVHVGVGPVGFDPRGFAFLLTSESSPLGPRPGSLTWVLDLGQVEDPVDALLQGPRFDPGTHHADPSSDP